MGDAHGQVTVVSQQQQPRGVVVQATDRKDPFFLAQARDIRRDVRPVLRIVQRRDDARRFVQRIVKRLSGGLHPLAVDLDAVFEGIGLGAQFVDHGAIDRDATLDDPALRLPARSQARPGDNFLQPFHLV